MRFNIKISHKARQLLLLHGAPAAIVRPHTLDLSRTLSIAEINSGKINRAISSKKQLTWFKHLYQDLPIEPKIIISNSMDFYEQARIIGLLLFWRYLSYSLNYPDIFHASTPLWYIPEAGFNTTPQEQYRRGRHREPNLLVVDLIHDDMPAAKVDKVHDLLQTMCDRPRLLLIRSQQPYNYCLNKLGVRPNMLFNIERQVQRRII